jgi:hypothetical protein
MSMANARFEAAIAVPRLSLDSLLRSLTVAQDRLHTKDSGGESQL